MKTGSRMLGLCAASMLICAAALAGEQMKITSDGSAVTIDVGAGGVVNAVSATSLSPMKMLLWSLGNDRQIFYGTIPLEYKVLGLTEEQMKAIEDLCEQARTENSELLKESKPPKSGRPEDYQAYYKTRADRQSALSEKYETRIMDVMTVAQKELLSQLKTLADEKAAEDKKINDEWRLRLQKNQDVFEGKLVVLLSPEQQKMLDAAIAAQKKPTGRRSQSPGRTGTPGLVPAGPDWR